MNWLLFGQIVLLIIIFAFVTNLVKCLHDTFAKSAKK